MAKKAYGDTEDEERIEAAEQVDPGDSETAFPASENVPGQKESRDAYDRLIEKLTGLLKEGETLPAWTDEYASLRAEGLDWRKAVYVAWSASPAYARMPKTLSELATEVLGLRSDRTIRNWRKRDLRLDERIAKLQAEPLFRHRADFYEALIACGTSPDPKCHQDRKLAFEMMGDYTPRGKVEADVVTFDPEEWKKHAAAQLTAAGATMALFSDTPENTPTTPDVEDTDE